MSHDWHFGQFSVFVFNHLEQRSHLEDVSRDTRNENPMLNWLKDLICDEFNNIPDSRGIIFCKTREMTVALVNWMKDTEELRRFNPHNLVGTNAPSNKAGPSIWQRESSLIYLRLDNLLIGYRCCSNDCFNYWDVIIISTIIMFYVAF